MNSLLKNAALMAVLMFCTISSAQDFSYYIEIDKKLTPTTKDNFEKSIDHHINVDVYLENDKRKIAVLYVRQREGKLTTVELAGLRQYLNQANDEKIKDDEFIIINYITSYPAIEPQETLSSWSILNKSFYNKAQKLAPGKMFYIYNQQQPNAIYSYKRKHIKWFSDKDNYVLKLLFPAEANYGNAAVIRPDGTFMTYIGEYGPDEVYKMIDKLKQTDN